MPVAQACTSLIYRWSTVKYCPLSCFSFNAWVHRVVFCCVPNRVTSIWLFATRRNKHIKYSIEMKRGPLSRRETHPTLLMLRRRNACCRALCSPAKNMPPTFCLFLFLLYFRPINARPTLKDLIHLQSLKRVKVCLNGSAGMACSVKQTPNAEGQNKCCT